MQLLLRLAVKTFTVNALNYKKNRNDNARWKVKRVVVAVVSIIIITTTLYIYKLPHMPQVVITHATGGYHASFKRILESTENGFTVRVSPPFPIFVKFEKSFTDKDR
jgi:predicted dienelactone hydrolase